MTTRLSTAQRNALAFLSGSNLAFTLADGTPAAQIKVRTARPLLALGLVATDRSVEGIAADCAAGGWLKCGLTDAGRKALA